MTTSSTPSPDRGTGPSPGPNPDLDSNADARPAQRRANRPRQLAFRVWLGASLVLILVFALAASRIDYELERDLWWTRASGWSALAFLFLSLSITPLQRSSLHLMPSSQRWLPAKQWLALRRGLGMAAALWAGSHALWTLLTYLDGSWGNVLRWPYLRAGLVALAILMALLLTSFPRLVSLLRVRLWKQLHRLAYVAALFLLQHLLLSPFAPRQLTILLFAGLLAVGLLRLLPARRKTPPQPSARNEAVSTET